MNSTELAARIRNIPDFPKPGIQFKDITTLLQDGEAFQAALKMFIDRYAGRNIGAVAGIESRGFIISAPLAYELGVGMVPIRKPGKLPAETYAVEYALEYGVKDSPSEPVTSKNERENTSNSYKRCGELLKKARIPVCARPSTHISILLPNDPPMPRCPGFYF